MSRQEPPRITPGARVVQLEEVSPGVFLFCLMWSSEKLAPRLRPGQHLKLFAPNIVGVVPGQWCGKTDPEFGETQLSRRYTPVASGACWHDVIVEVISAKRRPPDGGKFGRFAEGLQLGDSVSASGPHGLYSYLGGRRFERRSASSSASAAPEELEASAVTFVASGVAANTVLSLVEALLAEPAPPPVRLLLATASVEAAAPYRQRLEALRDQGKSLWLHYALTTPSGKAWPYSSGSLADLLAAEASQPFPGEGQGSHLVLSFGAPGTKKLCEEALGGKEGGNVLWHWNEELDL